MTFNPGSSGTPGSGTWVESDLLTQGSDYGIKFCARLHPTLNKVNLFMKVRNSGAEEWSEWKSIYTET